MVEKTNVGMADFIADITSIYGFGLDGAADHNNSHYYLWND